jgi:CHAD domain-containing protein
MTSDVKAGGDRLWSEAAAETLADLTGKVRKRAKAIHGDVDVEAVHDMRTATRRLRTAITIYGEDADKDDRESVEDELRRITRRLGAVRDLDVLLETLEESSTAGGETLDPDNLDPLRRTWQDERAAGAERLKDELGRGRFDDALAGAEQLGRAADDGAGARSGDGDQQLRVAHRAPTLVWASFGKVLAYEIDPLTADPAAIHEMRISAKKLRYTLEAFRDALEPGATLIEEVMALQDAAGEMHDATVARDRARDRTDGADDLGKAERAAIGVFAEAQDHRAEACRPITARHLTTVRSRAFRASLARALAGMGHVAPT